MPRTRATYKGKRVRIHGANSPTFDLQGLARGLDEALQATLTYAAKFKSLAAKLGASSPDAKDELRKRVESVPYELYPSGLRLLIGAEHPCVSAIQVAHEAVDRLWPSLRSGLSRLPPRGGPSPRTGQIDKFRQLAITLVARPSVVRPPPRPTCPAADVPNVI